LALPNNDQKLAALASGFDLLWRLPAEVSAVLSAHISGRDDLAYFIPPNILADDVTDSINENNGEILKVLKVYRIGCRMAAIGLCGLIETLLHAIYEKFEGKHQRKAGDSMRLAADSRAKKSSSRRLQEQFSLIKKFRNKAVHGGIAFPTDQQAEAIVLLTRDMLEQIVQLRSPESTDESRT
jgi:hypothetical protein